MRAFDLLTKTDFDIRCSSQPRYHLEMALLRWIHLRKLVPISDLIEGADSAGSGSGKPAAPPGRAAAPRPPSTNAPTVRAIEARKEALKPATPPPGPDTTAALPDVQPVPAARFKEAFLEEIKKQKKFFYGAVIAQAQRIDVDGDRVAIVFSPHHRALRAQFDQTRPLLETMAAQISGRKMSVIALESAAAPPAPQGGARAAAAGDSADPARSAPRADGDRKTALREQALADSGVQAMLDVFAAEIKEVEEM
jgi:hypothetical protein